MEVKRKDLKSKYLHFNGEIIYCRTLQMITQSCDQLLANAEKGELVLGFDTEWPFDEKGSYKTALIQICASEKECFLFHVWGLEQLPTSFITLINHPNVKLVGCFIHADIHKLGKDFNTPMQSLSYSKNVIDLGHYYNGIYFRSVQWSLCDLAEKMLLVQVEKNNGARQSNWGSEELTLTQKLYAATDAYASLLIYKKIHSLYLNREEQELLALELM